MGFYLKTFLGAALFLASVVAFNYALIQLLEVGTCASGNTPYEIARPCPSGVGADIGLLVGSIFAGLLGAAIFAFRGERPGHKSSLRNTFSWGAFAWGLFFAGTGAASLYASLTDSQIDASAGGKLGGIIVGITFLVMGIPAIIFALWGFFGGRGEGSSKSSSPSGPAPTAEGGLLDSLRSSAGSAAGTASAGWRRVTPSRGGGGGDALDKIDRLNRLRRSGALTEAEFEKEKAKLLAE